MKIAADYVVIGAGLTGATIARLLSDAGRDVVVIERRPDVAGNVADYMHVSGIRVHAHGPHYFRTSSENIWRFVTRFAQFYEYRAQLKARIDGRLENWPIAASFIRRAVGMSWAPSFSGTPRNFEEASLGQMPRLVYEKFIKEYNEKQWGVPAHTLAAELCGRFDVRHDDDPVLKPKATYQGLPLDGYSTMVRRMIIGIPTITGCDYLQHRDTIVHHRKLIFTGPIDAFFGHDLGRLSYRGQQRTHTYMPDVDYAQLCGQINTPQHVDGPQIRILEWKHMMRPQDTRHIKGTVLTTEVPCTPEDEDSFEYPFPDEANAKLYQRYRLRANDQDDVLICGRLGEYRYYDMDQAVGRAMKLGRQLLGDQTTSVAA